MKRIFSAILACAAGLALAPAAHARITLDFDYSLDTGFFTSNPAAKTALERAATVYSDRLLDQFTDITPGNGNTWNTNFTNPSTGANTQIFNLTIPANSIKIYVGGANLGGALGQGGPGGFFSNQGDSTFVSNLLYRGQTGAADNPPSDFGKWGGTISFDKTVAWNFDLTAPAAGKNDFLTVATHELAHVLGFGTSDAWRAKLTPKAITSGTQYIGPFTGPKAMKLNNNTPVPLETPSGTNNAQHFQNSLQSTVGGVAQETLMDPDITTGTRKKITLLDWATLDDIGWDLARGGDATADGSVDFDDLAKLAQSYNVTDGQRRWSDGDFNYDGNVDFLDLSILAQNYNTTGVQGATAAPAGASADFTSDWAAAIANVPEPTTLALAGLLLIPALKRRRRAK
ncbi:MAG: hypothetical protein JWN40_5745 [Phycisphaerales bacterium]|nr:hypothetical protein [Phycisphaerales bacterium]